MNTKIVYITGCLGFIGGYITRACLKRGWYVRGIDKITYAANPSLLDEFNQYENFIFEKLDINDIPFLYDCDYIINAAGESHVDNSIISSNDFIHTNINGVKHILDLIRLNRNEKKPIFLHLGTDECYGDSAIEHKETDLLSPSSPYSCTKCCSDLLIQSFNRTYSIPYIIVRLSNNYGISQYVEKLIPKCVKYLKLGRKIPLHDFGQSRRIWLHASDSANAILTLIDKEVKNDIYNVKGDYECINKEVVDKICKLCNITNIEEHIIYGKRPGQDEQYKMDDSKIRSLGWKPLIDFDKELPNIVKFYYNNFIW